jgi:peptidyl-prolyl cis-trans isomerase C
VKPWLPALGLALMAACVAPVTPVARPREYLVSHILCATEPEAQRALDRIRAGEPFEQVARSVSLDPTVRTNGGRLPYWTEADSYTATFAAEVKRLKAGELSARPTRSEFGWSIVRVDEVRIRPAGAPRFDKGR